MRRAEQGLPSQQPWLNWRSSRDSSADIREGEVIQLLRAAPKLKAIALLRTLQVDYPERLSDCVRRPFGRHVSQ